MKKLVVLATFAAFASPLWAAPQTVTLPVDWEAQRQIVKRFEEDA